MAGEGLRIIHPTDFSEASAHAFAHALKFAIETRGDLFLLHLQTRRTKTPHWSEFPRVRETLHSWGLLEEGAGKEAVERQLGIQVAKFDLVDSDVVHGVRKFTETYGGDVVVLSTEARQGLSRLLIGSKAEAILRSTGISTLFVPAHAQGFVDPATGAMNLRSVVAPVDHIPNPLIAIRQLVRIMGPFGLSAPKLKFIHVGADAPKIWLGVDAGPAAVECLDGSVVKTILHEARNANLIAVATAGHHGILDALMGSTTEQIVRNAPCPVLAIPSK